jgi:hypothetical protein
MPQKSKSPPNAHAFAREGIARDRFREKYAWKITTQTHKHPSASNTSAVISTAVSKEPSGRNRAIHKLTLLMPGIQASKIVAFLAATMSGIDHLVHRSAATPVKCAKRSDTFRDSPSQAGAAFNRIDRVPGCPDV